jgi:hypothetical protein
MQKQFPETEASPSMSCGGKIMKQVSFSILLCGYEAALKLRLLKWQR